MGSRFAPSGKNSAELRAGEPQPVQPLPEILTRPGFPEHHIQPGRAAPSTSPATSSHPVGTHGPTVKQALTPQTSPFPINLSSNEMEIYQREPSEKANRTERAEIGKHREPNPALPIKLMRCAEHRLECSGARTQRFQL